MGEGVGLIMRGALEELSGNAKPYFGWPCLSKATRLIYLGDSKNTVRGYCLDIPRLEESLNN